MPRGFPVDGFLSSLGYAARPEDLLISTYPKCGTTWMQHIVWLLLNHGEPLDSAAKMTEVIPHLEEVGKGVVEALPEPRVLKTHLPFALCPHHAQMKVIYVARNPFDCVVSFFHHTRGFPQHYDFADGTFDDYFECFLAGEVDFGDYFENVGSWLGQTTCQNFLLLTYEQMKLNPRSSVLAVSQFLGEELGTTETGKDVLDRVLEYSSFDAMQRDQLRWSSKRPETMPEFVRKGIVGDWANHLSVDQARRLLDRLYQSRSAERMRALWPVIIDAVERFTESRLSV